MSKDYVPRTLDGYANFAFTLVEKVRTKQENVWNHIPNTDFRLLDNTHEDFKEYYQLCKGPCTSADRNERNRRHKESERVLRTFVKNHLHQDPVTDKDRDEMGIPNPKTTRTQRTEVKALISFDIIIRGTNNVVIDFSEAGSASKAKPTGCNALIKYVVKDTAPQSQDEFTSSTLATRTPHTLEFPNEFSGRRIWIVLCWQNTRGILGRWTEMQTAIIP